MDCEWRIKVLPVVVVAAVNVFLLRGCDQFRTNLHRQFAKCERFVAASRRQNEMRVEVINDIWFPHQAKA